MKYQIKTENRNPICSIATIYDHLYLNGYDLNEKLIYLACLKSLFISVRADVKEMPFFLIAPVENGVDLCFFKEVGFEIEDVCLKDVLKKQESHNIIAYFDYYTLLSKNTRKKKYNICPIHTTLIIESSDEGWILNELEVNESGENLSVRDSEQIIEANSIELYPYPVANKSYQIIPKIHPDELEKRTVSIIDRNLKRMVNDCEVYRGSVYDGKATLFYGLQAYDTLINFFKYLQDEYKKGLTANQNRVYGIMIMTFRRFLLPMSGTGSFFRDEMAHAFEYYSQYKKIPEYKLISDKLLISAREWKYLGNLVTEIAGKKEKLPDLIVIIEKLELIKKIELEAIDILKEIIFFL